LTTEYGRAAGMSQAGSQLARTRQSKHARSECKASGPACATSSISKPHSCQPPPIRVALVVAPSTPTRKRSPALLVSPDRGLVLTRRGRS